MIEIQHMKFQESAVSKAILSTVYSLLQSTVSKFMSDEGEMTPIVHNEENNKILLDWRQCGNSLAHCYLTVVMKLPDFFHEDEFKD